MVNWVGRFTQNTAWCLRRPHRQSELQVYEPLARCLEMAKKSLRYRHSSWRRHARRDNGRSTPRIIAATISDPNTYFEKALC